MKTKFFILLLLCIGIHLSCQEDKTAYPSEKIKQSFNLDKYQEIDLLDYLSIESGVACLYEKKVAEDIDYIELFLFSSMGKTVYHAYRENKIWMVSRDRYEYNEPYNSKEQVMTRFVFRAAGQTVSFIKTNGETEKADAADSQSINRIINVANEIIDEYANGN